MNKVGNLINLWLISLPCCWFRGFLVFLCLDLWIFFRRREITELANDRNDNDELDTVLTCLSVWTCLKIVGSNNSYKLCKRLPISIAFDVEF